MKELEILIAIMMASDLHGPTRPAKQVIPVTIYSVDALPIQIYRTSWH
jgi:hypothetical protein